MEKRDDMLIINNKYMKYIFLFLSGGFAYGCVEVLFRGHSHISMLIAGGICFILIGLLNQIFTWNMALISQMAISAVIITVVELITGIIVNVWLGLKVWDYSSMPYNFRGQICLLFTNIWFFLYLFAILLDDYLRYFMLKEEKPHYKII
jgi:uncharacterized membrane protein